MPATTDLSQPLAFPPAPPARGGAMTAGITRHLANRLIAASSLVPNDPVLDMRDFAWTASLRTQWRAVAAESGRAAALWRDGAAADGAAARFPTTLGVLAAVPGLHDAAFSVLAARTHQPALSGPTKGRITCHLGLVVPRDGDVRMRIADRVVRWAEGETLVFDDSQDHEMWNDSDADRIVLALRFARPLSNPGRWVAARFPRLAA